MLNKVKVQHYCVSSFYHILGRKEKEFYTNVVYPSKCSVINCSIIVTDSNVTRERGSVLIKQIRFIKHNTILCLLSRATFLGLFPRGRCLNCWFHLQSYLVKHFAHSCSILSRHFKHQFRVNVVILGILQRTVLSHHSLV